VGGVVVATLCGMSEQPTSGQGSGEEVRPGAGAQVRPSNLMLPIVTGVVGFALGFLISDLWPSGPALPRSNSGAVGASADPNRDAREADRDAGQGTGAVASEAEATTRGG